MLIENIMAQLITPIMQLIACMVGDGTPVPSTLPYTQYPPSFLHALQENTDFIM
jgi:hypothetical protein